MVWTLTTRGKIEKAYASMKTDYFIDDVVKASETGALGAGSSSPEIRANKPPVVTVEGEKARTAKLGEPLTLTVIVTDDGVPKPRSGGGGGAGVRAGNQVQPGQSTEPSSVITTPNRGAVNRAYIPPVPGHGGQDGRTARVVDCLPRLRDPALRPGSGEGVGRHADGREFPLGATVGAAAGTFRWEVCDTGHIRSARNLSPQGDRRRRCAARDGRPCRHRCRFDCTLTSWTGSRGEMCVHSTSTDTNGDQIVLFRAAESLNGSCRDV